MSFGLPSHLMERAASSSFVRGLHAIALSCLAAAFLEALVFQLARPDQILWPAMIAILPMIAILLWMQRRSRSLFVAVSYLVIGGFSTYWFIATFMAQKGSSQASGVLSVDLPMIALVMVGGPGRGVLVRFLWCVAGYAVAEATAAFAAVGAGHTPAPHVGSLLAFAVTSAVLLLSWLSRRRSRRTQPVLHRAARDDQVASMRYRIEVKAAALMHDTVLSHLAAIADSTTEVLSPQLRSQIERDLEILVGEEWLNDDSDEVDARARHDWQASGLFSAIEEARAMGLEVEATGDLGSVGRLDRDASTALGLAVKQCLVNVLRHSGTTQAEVVAYPADGELSVMVIDAGRGFSEATTGADRLGLRTSVRRRMEAVGGSVQVWSTPGRGTSIMIRIPTTLPGLPTLPAEERPS